MLGMACALARKDLRIIFSSGGNFCQAILLGGLLIFLFSLSRGAGETVSGREAAAIFWLSSIFCQILVFGNLYAIEEANDARQTLLLSPAPVQGIWLGKALGALILLLFAQTVFLPATAVFLDQGFAGSLWPCLAGIGAVDCGIVILGSLLGALGRGQPGHDALLSILLFPLLTPLLMAGLNICAPSLDGGDMEDVFSWLGIALAFDAVFLGAALLMFGFLYRGEE